METERELLDAIHSDDPQAMRRLYDRFSGYAMAIGLRYVPEREDVKDVLQDSFVKIIGSVGGFTYRGEGSLKAWVARIVTNEAIDWLKIHERIHLIFEQRDQLPEDVEDEPPDMEEVPSDILNVMIGRLPAGCRLVLNLYAFEQLSHREIACRLSIQEGSSASQLSYAKRLLKRMIKEYINSQRK
ncbi:MAG: sigma-70 family RNA polymerase sigma factor [Prevotella sp.]|nr:sigma-70 family RNA polymerase sigma factor [Prevotella sp.]